ncbi:MAG: DUF4350 domain-containing protein [Saprospiraceae bacterium]|nr:DUF4350 domain-containing protein [Pyrinomonadaceae bacterium]
MKNKLLVFIAAAIFSAAAYAQQVPDTAFAPAIPNPMYKTGRGPIVLLDEAHFNFHTADGRYLPFAALLRRDGYDVKASKSKFSKTSLKGGKILVIANALAERNKTDWTLPTPTAFSADEVDAVTDWVKRGGSLMIIVDHMPFPGAAENLAKAFGLTFSNGYAINPNARGPMVFKLADLSLRPHAILNGRNDSEKIDSVATFTGSAFQAAGDVQPLFILGNSVVSAITTTAGEITKDTPQIPVGGWYQGAVMRFGKGRVAVFGEAAMFSAQLAGPNRGLMGMNAPVASQNPQFLLNVMHWLSGKLEG